MKTRLLSCSVIFLLGLLLAGCGGGNDPAKVVQRYLAGKVAQDEDVVRNLLCSELEGSYEMELYSFASSNDASIEDMACSQRGTSAVVDCTGTIIVSYGEEHSEFPLSAYRVVQEDGEWKWCGEAP
jgi:hypothetical protein